MKIFQRFQSHSSAKRQNDRLWIQDILEDLWHLDMTIIYTIMTYLTYQIFRSYCGIPCGKSNMSSCLEPCDFCSSLNSRLAACTRASRCLSVPKQISNRPGFNQIHQKTVSKWSIIRFIYIYIYNQSYNLYLIIKNHYKPILKPWKSHEITKKCPVFCCFPMEPFGPVEPFYLHLAVNGVQIWRCLDIP
jgi:hypothetical protein